MAIRLTTPIVETKLDGTQVTIEVIVQDDVHINPETGRVHVQWVDQVTRIPVDVSSFVAEAAVETNVIIPIETYCIAQGLVAGVRE